jgi:hypothetical protein
MNYTPNNQTSAWPRIILILVTIGFIVGIALLGSDILNPIQSISRYQSEQLERDNARWESEIDRNRYIIISKAQTRATLLLLSEETQHLQDMNSEELNQVRRLNEQELRRIEQRNSLTCTLIAYACYAAIAVVVISATALSVGFSIRIARGSPKQATATQAAAGGHWTRQRRRAAIEAARSRERVWRAEHQRASDEEGTYIYLDDEMSVPA